MTRAELIARTRRLVEEGDRIQQQPSMHALRTWLHLSDELLSAAWGSMDRYHLAWLMVGKPKGIVRGRPMRPDEETAYVHEVAEQKTAALRMSLDAVERQGMPFRGEEAGVAPGQGMGELPSSPPRELPSPPRELPAPRDLPVPGELVSPSRDLPSPRRELPRRTR